MIDAFDYVKLLPFIIILNIVIFIAEMTLSFQWNEKYYCYGIPVFVKYYSANKTLPNFDNYITKIQQNLHEEHGLSFELQTIGKGTYAFRREMKFTTPNITRRTRSKVTTMHGVFRYQPESGDLTLTGYLNWYPMIFTLLIAYLPLTLDVNQMLVIGIWFIFLLATYSRETQQFTTIGNTIYQYLE